MNMRILHLSTRKDSFDPPAGWPEKEFTMESWRKVWREGFAPVMSTTALDALWQALRRDDKRLLQGATCHPQPLSCHSELDVDCCCSISWGGWQGEKLGTVAEVDEYFARICFEADQRLGEPGASRWFLNWYDDTPRAEMRLEMLDEVQRTLEQRFIMDRLNNVAGRRQRVGRAGLVTAA